VTGSVLLDTNVFTSRLREESPLATIYGKHIVGRRLLVTPQTLAEARYGALKAAWGPVRLGRLAELTARTRRLPVDPETIEAAAQLRNRCRMVGHGLHQREHNADLWIAAAAIRWSVPVVAHDAVFIDCPGLDLRTELSAGRPE
jgi:predicted nucleic acid-binding protein